MKFVNIQVAIKQFILDLINSSGWNQSMNQEGNNLLENVETREIKVITASDDIYQMLLFRVYEKRLRDVWNNFVEHKINPILIKGWAAAVNYPNPHLRRIGDFDVAVNPCDFERALDLQKNLKAGEVDVTQRVKTSR